MYIVTTVLVLSLYPGDPHFSSRVLHVVFVVCRVAVVQISLRIV